LGIITTPLICLGIITVLIFGDYYVAFWGLLLSSISGIIQATHCGVFPKLPLLFSDYFDCSQTTNNTRIEVHQTNI
jgi:hypothetical protein